MSTVLTSSERGVDRVESVSRDEAIYRHIYTAIVEHHITPGTKLPEDALAEVFGVSRTVVRKVLGRLAHEGLLSIARNRGARVAAPTVGEARGIFEARRIVECAAMLPVAVALSAADLRAMRRIAAEEQEAESAGDPRQLIRMSGEFHVRLMAISANEPLTEFLRQLVARSSLIIAMYSSPGGRRQGCHDHGALLDLLERGDAEHASEWMNEHLRAVESSLNFSDRADGRPNLRQIFAAIDAPESR